MLVWASKDPDEVVVRSIDWSKHPSWIAGDSLLSATFLSNDLTAEESDYIGTETSFVTLSGGADESRGQVLCGVVTNNGQTLQQTATILIRAR